MAIVTGQNRDRAVARPPWVRRHDNQHEPVVAGIMLALVIVGIAVFLFWGPLLRMAVTGAWFHAPGAPTDRPAEGATPPGPAVVVTLDQPVAPSQAAVIEGALAASGVSQDRAAAQSAHPDQIAEPAPAGLLGPSTLAPAASERGDPAEAKAAAANDAAETAQAAEAARAASAAPAANARAAAVPAATPAPTVAPAATATPRATPAATSVPTSVAAASGRRARVVRTGGRGVVMYSAPRQGARLPAGILEGTVVSVLGTSGAEWTQVQADGGRSGWVRSEFLAPAN